MSQKLVQVNAKLLISPEQCIQACTPQTAQPFAVVVGLQWKIWIINSETGEVGGIMLFENEDTLQAYLESLWAEVKNNPVWTDVQMKVFDILSGPSKVTRAPLGNHTPLTFHQMVQEALAAVPSIKPADLYRRLHKEPDLLIIDVRDSSQVAKTGTVPGAVNITMGDLTYLADHDVPESWRDPRLADRSRPIVTTCILGPLGAIGGKLLQDMGFEKVQILEGGVQSWIDADLPVDHERESLVG